MKTKSILLAAALGLLVVALQPSSDAQAQSKSLAASIGVQVFPSAGQASSVQSQDEAACYQWAVKNTGVDPFQAQKQAQEKSAAAQQQTANANAGAGMGGAAKGAAGGALIGAIAGDAGKGAAIGAATGFVAGRARKRHNDAQAEEYTQNVNNATAAQIDSFKKAFSACLEGKHYIAKY
ncbi:MAG TPA: glycine zipper domain-containing protein [Thermoanaerobaculia bacterium]|jgi:uncharacterized membrane protein